MNYNRVILVGRVGRAPEMRATSQGVPVAHFSLATSETWKDKTTNEKKEQTSWHRIVAFNKLANFVGNYISQGRLILVEGRVQSRDQLLRDVWHYESLIDTRTVDTHMRRLREKLGPAAEHLDTVRGVGYRFVE